MCVTVRCALGGSGRALPSSSAVPRGWGPPWCLMGTTAAVTDPFVGSGHLSGQEQSLLSTGAVTLSADLQLKLSSLSQRLSCPKPPSAEGHVSPRAEVGGSRRKGIMLGTWTQRVSNCGGPGSPGLLRRQKS